MIYLILLIWEILFPEIAFCHVQNHEQFILNNLLKSH